MKNHAIDGMYQLLSLRETAIDAQKIHSFSWTIYALKLEKGMDFTMKQKKYKLRMIEDGSCNNPHCKCPNCKCGDNCMCTPENPCCCDDCQ